MVSDSSDSDARSAPLRRRGGQMLFAACAVSGGTSPPTARSRPPGDPFVRRITRRPTTGAPSRGVGWEEGTAVHIRRSSVPIAKGPTGRGLRPAPARRPASRPGGGFPHPPHDGSAGLPRQTPRRPREVQGRRRWRARCGRRSSSRRGPWRSRPSA